MAKMGGITHPFCLFAFLFIAFASTASAASAVLGIDFGGAYIKAAIVKPGVPLDIVPTKDSKRKEAAVVGFKPVTGSALEFGSYPERLYGGDALALGGRFPADVFTNLKTLLGLVSGEHADSMIKNYHARHPAVKSNFEQEKGAVSFVPTAFSLEEARWNLDELLAMELKNIRANAEAMSGGKGGEVTDAVITVPVHWTADERRAIERAADLAGINIMSLVSDGLAVGIDYAVKRTFPSVTKGEKPEYHMVFDMGAGSTTATVLRFQSKDVKDIGRFNKTIQEVAVVGAGWDKTLGGDELNALIVDYLVDSFVAKPQAVKAGITAEEVKSHGRTASKIWREAERARQVLSANSDVRSSFEGLYNDIDFATKLTRAEFEKMAASHIDRIQGPVQQALDAAKLSFKDLDSVILHGGAIRTPFVQKKLESMTGKNTEVRSNVNSDESAAFGAAFKAAGLSPSFRVKEIRDLEAAVYPAGIKYPSDGKERSQKLFVPTSQAGSAKEITLKNLDDFTFGIFQVVNGVDRPVTEVHTQNLTASVEALTTKFGCSKDEISTKLKLRISPVDSIPEIVTASVSCEVEGGKAAGIGDSVKGLFGFGSKKGDQEPLIEDEEVETVKESSSSSSSSSSSAANAKSSGSASAEAEKNKKRTETIPIKLTTVAKGLPQPAPEDIKRMKERLAAFDRSDMSRIQREEALNALEAYTYRTRDLLENSDFVGASTEAVRAQLTSLLSSTSEWLYGEGSSAKAEAFKSKLAALKAIVDPVQKRREEASARPEILKSLQSSLDQTKSMVDAIGKQIAASISSASEAALSSSTTSEASPSPSAADDLDGLEEPDASSTSSSAKPSESASMMPYTEEDLASITKAYESVAEWVKTKMAEQDKLQAFEDPAFTVKEVEIKAKELNKALMDMVTKKMQMPKRSTSSSSSSSKKPKATKSKKAKSSSGETSTASEAASSSASPSVVVEEQEKPIEHEEL
ncbi:actin-like ATPase domain-containing protein [Aureobasidium sp. EXF-10728]|nr:actin-like ATPase domain-containing protein [Aureobasidium sp. EXF-10728]